MKNTSLTILHTNLLVQINAIRDIVKKYELENKTEFITQTIETYVSRIIPIVKKIMDQTYRLTMTEKDTEIISNPKEPDISIDVVKLIQSPYTIKDLYVLGPVKPKINSNIY